MKMTHNFRIVLLLLIGVLQHKSLVIVHSQTGFILKMQKNMKYHESPRFETVTVRTMTECFQHCIADCRCMSFDLHNITDENCRLHESSIENGLMHLTPSDDCNHYEFTQTPNNQQCDHSCTTAVNCCLTSNPCRNGGTCSPSIKSRYQCACATRFSGRRCAGCQSGYTGNHCQEKITSCRGYANDSRISKNYVIFNSGGRRVNVFCDFDVNSTVTWTLVQSFKFSNGGKFNHWFMHDKTYSEDKWTANRLPKADMQLIQKDSTKWRITCDYEKLNRVVERDSIRVSFSRMDLLTASKDGDCILVEYINVRGYNCSNCTAVVFQAHNSPFHFDSARSLIANCSFKAYEAKTCKGSGGEDNFGRYSCVNKDHRCSANGFSTTQTWFGG